MEDNDEEQADAIEQVFDLDYDVAQAFWALDNGMDFEPEDGEGDDDYNNKGGDYKGGGGMVFPFPALVKTTGE